MFQICNIWNMPIDCTTGDYQSLSRWLLPHSAVFTWTNLLVVVAELSGSEQEALDLVPLITGVVLEEHHLIVGVVVVVDPGVIPINSRGEKQRMHLRDSFLADQLDPIYVAYNMWAVVSCFRGWEINIRRTPGFPKQGGHQRILSVPLDNMRCGMR